MKHRTGDEFNPSAAFRGLFIPEGLAASTAYSGTAKLAYGHLVRRANRDGMCWPSIRDIASHIGVSERTAQRALSELQSGDHPLIRAKAQANPAGRQTTNMYSFLWQICFDEGDKNDVGEGDINDAPEGDKNDTGRVTRMTPSGGDRNVTQSIQSNNQIGTISDRTSDDSFDSRKPRAKSKELALPSPLSDEIRTIRGEQPPAWVIPKLLTIIGDSASTAFTLHLRGVHQRYRPGGHRAVRTWEWFFRTAESWMLSQQTYATPAKTEQFDAMTDAFDTTSRFERTGDMRSVQEVATALLARLGNGAA